MMKNLPLPISVAIIARNEEENLKRNLEKYVKNVISTFLIPKILKIGVRVMHIKKN